MNNFSSKRSKSLGLALLILFLIGCLSFYLIGSRKHISLEVEGVKKEFTSRKTTVGDFLNKENIELQKKSYINFPLDEELEDGMHIIIKEAKNYKILVGNKEERKSLSPFNRVEDILKDGGVSLGSLDYTEPGLKEEVSPGATIKVFRVKEVVKSVEKDIPFQRTLRKNKSLEKGKENILQKGEKGKKLEEIKEVYVNGQLVETKLIKETVKKEALDELIEKGTMEVAQVSRGASHKNKDKGQPKKGPGQSKKAITMSASAYTAPGCKTASGTMARYGAVAVDPNVIPMGTRLYVKSLDGSKDYGYCVAEDRGLSIKGNKIDLYFNSMGECLSWGRRNVKVYILD